MSEDQKEKPLMRWKRVHGDNHFVDMGYGWSLDCVWEFGPRDAVEYHNKEIDEAERRIAERDRIIAELTAQLQTNTEGGAK